MCDRRIAYSIQKQRGFGSWLKIRSSHIGGGMERRFEKGSRRPAQINTDWGMGGGSKPKRGEVRGQKRTGLWAKPFAFSNPIDAATGKVLM